MATRTARGRGRGKKASSSVTVNFDGVESKRKTPAEDDYRVKVAEVTKEESSAGNDMIVFVFEIVKGDFKGAKLWLHCPLTEESLWKLRSVLECLGVEVPDDELEIEFSELIDLEMMAVVHHETYQGSKQAKIGDFYAVDAEPDEEEEEDEEEEDTKKSSKKKPAKKKPAKDEEDEEEDEEEEPEEEEEETPAERKRRRAKERRDARKAKPAKSSKSDEEEEDEEEEEEEKPAKKKASAKKTKKKETVSADDIQEMDEDALEEFVSDNELDVDLSEFKTLRKKQAAVIDAAEEGGLIE
jgi:flagellar biosynthesis GTPase FlhF